MLFARPMLYVNFFFSKPALDAQARWVIAQPFTSAGGGASIAGDIVITRIRRCPHGVALFTTQGSYGLDRGSDYFYRDEPGDCSRFTFDRHLWSNWYTFDN